MRSFVETKTFTLALFSVALVLVVVGILAGFENVLLAGVVFGFGGLIKVLVLDL